MRLSAFVILVSTTVYACGPSYRESVPDRADQMAMLHADPPRQARVAEEVVREIDAMRSGLAGGITAMDVTRETFAQVCRPVGLRAAGLGAERGWTIRQVSLRYRNPANQADPEAASRYDEFQTLTTLDSLWFRTSMNDVEGWRYLRRITVEESCLHCHGPRDSRPGFVIDGYPEDIAYDFEKGDLRGLYSVFIPDSTLQAH